MNCAQRFEQAVKAKQVLESYEKQPEKMEPLKYTELYATAIRYRVEYNVCCRPDVWLVPQSSK